MRNILNCNAGQYATTTYYDRNYKRLVKLSPLRKSEQVEKYNLRQCLCIWMHEIS